MIAYFFFGEGCVYTGAVISAVALFSLIYGKEKDETVKALQTLFLLAMAVFYITVGTYDPATQKRVPPAKDWENPHLLHLNALRTYQEEGAILWYPYQFSGMPSLFMGGWAKDIWHIHPALGPVRLLWLLPNLLAWPVIGWLRRRWWGLLAGIVTGVLLGGMIAGEAANVLGGLVGSLWLVPTLSQLEGTAREERPWLHVDNFLECVRSKEKP